MTAFVFVQGTDIMTDTWNRLTGREYYPPGKHRGGRYGDGMVGSPD